jgi:ABC-type arginine/histidine transport system permease subunit
VSLSLALFLSLSLSIYLTHEHTHTHTIIHTFIYLFKTLKTYVIVQGINSLQLVDSLFHLFVALLKFLETTNPILQHSNYQTNKPTN